MSEENYNKKSIKICGLWNNKDKNGKVFVSGPIDKNNKFYIFKNKFKKQDNHPDYQMFITGDDAHDLALRLMGEESFLKQINATKGKASEELFVDMSKPTQEENKQEALFSDDIPF